MKNIKQKVMSNKLIHAIFDDEEVLLKSVKELRSNNIEIEGAKKSFDF